MKKLLIFSVIVLFIGLSFSYFRSNAQSSDLNPEPCDETGNPCPNPTPSVASVVFESVNSVIDGNPNLENGSRIFPDKDSPTDTLNRKIVKVTATLNAPSVDGSAKIIFKTFDVDDPSISGVIDPNGVTGDDNNGSPKAGTLSFDPTTPGTSDTIATGADANGKASVYLTITMQPGDNFVVSATSDPGYTNGLSVSGTGLKHSVDGVLPTAKAKRTEMLTVWRRLHIEVDSMGAVTGNKVEGKFPADRKVGNGIQTLSVIPEFFLPLEVNRFEKGRMIIKTFDPNGAVIATRSLNIINPTGTINANTENKVTIINNFGTFNISTANQKFIIYDDDDFNNNDGTAFSPLHGDEGEDVPMIGHALLEQDSDSPTDNILAEAYIHLRYDIGNNNDSTMFFANVYGDDVPSLTALYEFNQIGTEADSDFWTTYLLSGYQYIISEDEDPENDNVVPPNPHSTKHLSKNNVI